MKRARVPWVSEAEVVDAIDLDGAIAALEAALPGQLRGDVATMAKTHLAWGGGHTLHALGGLVGNHGIVGVKSWAHAGGAEPLLALWDANDGHLLAVIEAFALGQMRTAAMSAIATRWLAAPDAAVLAVVGSGRQAAAQVAAVVAVRRITHVRVHSRTPANRYRFADQLSEMFDADVGVSSTVREAVDSADVVTTITRATVPFLDAGDVGTRTHINAVGAITPERRELSPALVAQCGIVVTDSLPAAQELSSEIGSVAGIVDIASVIGHRPRSEATGPSLFKAMGLGVADVVLGAAVVAAIGSPATTITAPERHAPRLGSRSDTRP